MKHTTPLCFIGLLLTARELPAQILTSGAKHSTTDVYLQTMNTTVEVVGDVATTTFTMTFKNRTAKTLEGELVFPLPAGATVSRYALDINGKMRDAVPVPKAKAARVFEEIVQRRVDPGLLERVEGNNFRLRVYPFAPNATRTVTIAYEEELPVEDGALRYRLPFDYPREIEHFSLRATVWQGDQPPVPGEESRGELTFDRAGQEYVATIARENYRPPRLLAFALPVAPGAPRVRAQSAGNSHYFLAGVLPDITLKHKTWSDHLGIIWDVSLSGLQRDIPRELDLLGQVIRQKKNLTITLYLLDNTLSAGATFRVKQGDWSELRARLTALQHDGGTDLSALRLDGSPAGEFILFSDGLSTLGQAAAPRQRPVHCITSSPSADHDVLRRIAIESGGKYINLNAMSPDDITRELANDPLHYLGVEHPNTVREIYPSIPAPVRGNFSVAGILDAPSAAITLLFGRGGKIEQRVRIDLQPAPSPLNANIHRVWAQKKIAELDLYPEKNADQLLALGQQFGIVTRETSLLVLETASDYLQYDITPPDELRAEVDRLKKQQTASVDPPRTLIEPAATTAAELKTWWERDFSRPAAPLYPRPDAVPANRASATQMEALVDRNDHVVEEVDFANGELAETVVIAYATPRSARARRSDETLREVSAKEAGEPTATAPAIRLAPVKQDREYLKSLTGNPVDDYATYLALRPGYANSPTYYFDMADHFYRLSSRDIAIRVLTSIADLGIEDHTLHRLLGYRLREYAAYPLAVEVCRQVVRWTGGEARARRDLALAIADAGDVTEAITLFKSVIEETPLDNNAWHRAAKPIETFVTELNHLVQSRPDAPAIDPRLITRMLPVDIRVVLNWNMDNTDIDLHVIDPKGEHCYYSNRATTTGGRLSADVTDGFGPEQFMIRQAIPGKYQVSVNYFGDNRVKATGPSTVMLEIYTRYGDQKLQERRLVCLQLDGKVNDNANGLIPVAEFEF
ncbi:MAG: DUF2135 domain-containing protein [Odoribacteraceae bacterium]|jgi:tetratricopeptide (TPR) repeat protein|nr:DUF2135 domain-containing protein [Odoribacteraceae bacterium]